MAGVAALALVAHVAVLSGHATIVRAEGGNAVVALRNAPLLAGDTFGTLRESEAEIALDPSLEIRVDHDSSVQLVSLAAHHRDVRLTSGTVEVNAEPNADSPRVETPSVTLAPDAPGLFRIAVARGVTSVMVQRGTLRIVTPNGTEILGSNELVTIDGPSSQPTLRYATPTPSDAFDAFNAARDGARAAAQSDAHVPPSLNGITNLAAYGSWVTIHPYGAAWRPLENAGWAPYAQGRWLWRAPIGWTWTSRESWGWLPYHYGRWTHDSKLGWCWVPPPAAQPAPLWSSSTAALFTILARGHMVSAGWLPLAPSEPFHDRLSLYGNAGVPGAIHTLSAATFYAGDFSRVASPSLASLPAALRLEAPPPPRR